MPQRAPGIGSSSIAARAFDPLPLDPARLPFDERSLGVPRELTGTRSGRGLVRLFLLARIRGRVPAGLETTAPVLLSHLSLLFVPAGVGVMLHLARITEEWPAILAALLLSTWLTIAVAGLLFARLVGTTGPAPGSGDASRAGDAVP